MSLKLLETRGSRLQAEKKLSRHFRWVGSTGLTSVVHELEVTLGHDNRETAQVHVRCATGDGNTNDEYDDNDGSRAR